MIKICVSVLPISRSSLDVSSEIREELIKMLEMEDKSEGKVCVGLGVIWNRKIKSLKLKQKAYAEIVLSRFGVIDPKAVTTQMDTQLHKATAQDEMITSNIYVQAIGSVIYLMICSRPDIAFVVKRLLQYIIKLTKTM